MQHLDEGTIHAWLDGELSPAERAAVEAHIDECAQCAAAMAEARGFVAGSSRILTALDSIPGGVLPASSAVSGAPRPAVRRRFVTSRAWMAVAAVLVLSTVTVLATRPNGDTAQLQVAAAARDQKDASGNATPSHKEAQAMKPSEQPRASDSHGIGAGARVAPESLPAAPAPAPAAANTVSTNAPAPMQSRAAASVEEPKSVDQTERLKSRLQAERKSTLVRPSNGAPPPMADAASPSRNAEPRPSANRASDKPVAAPEAPGVAKDMAEKREDASPADDSLSGRSAAASVQNMTITGRVTNESGAPLGAASVALQGTHVSTLTHEDGTYELLVPGGRLNGKTASLVARVMGYKTAAASIALTSATITHDFSLASNPLALGQVVVTGQGTTSSAEKLRTVVGTDESPAVVSRTTSTESGDTVVTTIYAVSNGTVTLIERSVATDALRRQQGNAGFSDQVMTKARDDTRINSITWSDSTGRMRTLRGAVPREDLERIRAALFGPKP